MKKNRNVYLYVMMTKKATLSPFYFYWFYFTGPGGFCRVV